MITTLWHAAYCRWYDHNKAGHTLRAHAWGALADAILTANDALPSRTKGAA